MFARTSWMAAAILSLASIGQADMCLRDNCYNAMASSTRASAVSAFCTSLTNVAGPQPTQTVPLPTFIPTSCSPQRLSSACYCIDSVGNPSCTTPAPCATGQILGNPAFIGQGFGSQNRKNADIRPWVLAGAPGSLNFVNQDYSNSDSSQRGGDPRALVIDFNQTLGGKSVLSQAVNLCANTQYHFRMETSCRPSFDNPYVARAFGNTTVRVMVAGTTIWGPKSPCDPSCLASADGAANCRRNSLFTAADVPFTWNGAAGKQDIIIEVVQPAGLDTREAATTLDSIMINNLAGTGSQDLSDPLGSDCGSYHPFGLN